MVIAIGGCSRSGKTTLAYELAWYFRGQNRSAFVLSQDDFVKRINDIPRIADKTDWESPDSIDFEKMKQILRYFQTQFDVVILEGIFIFADPSFLTFYNHTFFVEISEATFRTRKAADTRWGEVAPWFVNHIWESHLRYGLPPKHFPNLTRVSGETAYDVEKLVEIFQ